MQVQHSKAYKGFLLATAGGLATATGAQAADLPLKAAPIAAPSWTGWYFGGHLGAAWQQTHAGYAGTYYNMSATRSSLIGGAQLGYNWQKGNFVYGVEADISGLSNGPRHRAYTASKGDSLQSDIRWLATFRGRMGLAVNDTMAYVTGGLAVASVKNTFAPHGVAPTTGNPAFTTKSGTKTKWGWTIGGGIEHMWTRNWTIALEGLFVDLGKNEVCNVDCSKVAHFYNQAIIGRFKMNYKF